MWSKTPLSFVLLLCLGATTVCGSQNNSRRIIDGRVTTPSGVSIHYLQSGSPTSDRALVLIPGWRLPAYLWREQLEKFSQIIRVIAIDPRSQGESTKITEGNSPESRARDLHDLLAAVGVVHPVLVGWSQGAQDVAAYVQQFGNDSVAAVVFVDSPVSIGPAEIEQHKEFSKIILSGISVYAEHPAEYSRGMVDSLFKQPHPDLDKDKVVESTLKTPTDIGIAMLVMDIFGADRSAALAKLDKPALVIASASSPLLDLQKAMAARIPGAGFVQIEGAGHAIFIDQPNEFDGTLKTFLQSIGHRSDACFHSKTFEQARAQFQMQFQTGQWEAVDDDVKRAMARRDSSSEMRALYAVQLAESALQRSAFSQSDPERVENLLHRADTAANLAKDPCLRTEVQFLYAQSHYWQAFDGKPTWSEVRKELDDVVKRSEEVHVSRHDLANALFYRGLVDQQAETGDLGEKYFERSQQIAVPEKDDFLLSFLERHLAVIDEARGNLAQAETRYRHSLGLREKVGATLYVPPAQAALAELLQKKDPNNPEAMQLRTAAAEGAARTRNYSMATDIHAALRDHLAASGDQEGALVQAEAALKFARAYGSSALISDSLKALEKVRVRAPGAIQDNIHIPRGKPITIDGVVSTGEWDDSQSVRIAIRPDWNVRVRMKHDDQNLYLLFEDVTHGSERLFPEVFLNPQNRRDAEWQKGQWWFHVSQNLCEGDGAPNVYRKNGVFLCAHQKLGWDANNPPGQSTQVEIRIAFSKINLVPTPGGSFGMALAMTDATGDTQQQWFFWPTKALVQEPDSWGVAILDGRAAGNSAPAVTTTAVTTGAMRWTVAGPTNIKVSIQNN